MSYKVYDKTFTARIRVLRTEVVRRTGPRTLGPFRRTTSVRKTRIRAVKIIVTQIVNIYKQYIGYFRILYRVEWDALVDHTEQDNEPHYQK